MALNLKITNKTCLKKKSYYREIAKILEKLTGNVQKPQETEEKLGISRELAQKPAKIKEFARKPLTEENPQAESRENPLSQVKVEISKQELCEKPKEKVEYNETRGQMSNFPSFPQNFAQQSLNLANYNMFLSHQFARQQLNMMNFANPLALPGLFPRAAPQFPDPRWFPPGFFPSFQ